MSETTRRLAAIAFADVVDWSRLIEMNDVATLRAWKALRATLIEPSIRERSGRLLEIAGDSVLVEFPSAVAAVIQPAWHPITSRMKTLVEVLAIDSTSRPASIIDSTSRSR